MSNLDRDLAREAALRERQRKAGCLNPACHVCGEGCIWCLVLSRYRPICGNCLADSRHDPGREAEMLGRFRKAGFDPRCIRCGEDRIWRLELDHIAGEKHDPDACAPLCKNCHMERSFMQDREPNGGENPQNVFEVIGRWLLGIAEWLELIVKKLYEFGEFLIGLAKEGYGAELKFPWA
jgi:hypothetical protein